MKAGARKKAKEAGLASYFTGEKCTRGHIALRNTKTGKCFECNRLDKKEWYEKNATHVISYRKENREKHTKQAKEWRKKNKDKVYSASSKYAKANPHKVNVWIMERHAAKMRRTPKWLTEDDKWMIEEIYRLASLRTKMFGVKWHVDHIIPLRGKIVSGLHVPSNLQVIPGKENNMKYNHYEP